MNGTTIRLVDDGPLAISGAVEVVDAEGRPFATAEGESLFLCRCGGSQNKPFCDGSHAKSSFDAKNRAVASGERS